jgi:subtilase family serine protease
MNETRSAHSARNVRAVALATAATTAFALVTVTGAGTAQAAGTGSIRLAGSKPAFATATADKGAVPARTPVDFDVVLSMRDAASATATLRAVATPGTAAYRHFLTTAQFRAAYAPTAASVAAVERWATSTGLHVAGTASLYVEVTGTTAQADKLFDTSLHVYASKQGYLLGTSSLLALPSGLAGTVAGVVGLDSSPKIAANTSAGRVGATSPAAAVADATPDETLPGPPAGGRYGVQPCSAYYGQKTATTLPEAYGAKQPYTICGYGAKQYESGFGYSKAIAAGNDGSGATVAIIDAYAAPTMPMDADIWSKQNGIPALTSSTFTQLVPKPDGYNTFKGCGGPQGWYGEETLDIEAVHAMAPGARILYVGGKNCAGGLDNALATVIDKHLASVVTNSYSDGISDADESAGEISFYTQYLIEAGLTGVSVLFSSGDDGDNTDAGGARFVTMPASDPYATAVGGTSTEIGATGDTVLQTGWSNDYAQLSADGSHWVGVPGSYSSGSGGGESGIFAEPFYQQGVVPASVSKHGSGQLRRAVPDISMPGDPNTGLRIGETQVFPNGTYYATYRLGGTSLSSPLLAGVLADTVQAVGSGLGLINPAIYSTYASTTAVTDVTSVSKVATVRTNLVNGVNGSDGKYELLQTLDVPTSISTRVGYDDMTGLGTPDGVEFYSAFTQ